MRAWVLLALPLVGCATLFGEQSGLRGEQLERIEAYRATQARDFSLRLATAKVNPREADLQAIVTVAAINAPLEKLNQADFALGDWSFVPTHAPLVELNTGSAILRITGNLKHGADGRVVEVTVVGGLAVRWSDDGSHLFFKPSSLAVVPTTHLSMLDFAMGDYIHSFAEGKADTYLTQRIGEIDVPINLMLPVQRKALALDQSVDVGPADPPAHLHYDLPAATAEVRLKQLYVWPLEGRLVVLAYADVADAPPPVNSAPPAAGAPPSPAAPAPSVPTALPRSSPPGAHP